MITVGGTDDGAVWNDPTRNPNTALPAQCPIIIVIIIIIIMITLLMVTIICWLWWRGIFWQTGNCGIFSQTSPTVSYFYDLHAFLTPGGISMMILVKMVEKKILLLVFGRHKVLPPIARMTRLATCAAFPPFSFSAKLLSGMPLLP